MMPRQSLPKYINIGSSTVHQFKKSSTKQNIVHIIKTLFRQYHGWYYVKMSLLITTTKNLKKLTLLGFFVKCLLQIKRFENSFMSNY